MLRLLAWDRHGYCNAFELDAERARRNSVGLGGNVSAALRKFEHDGRPGSPPGSVLGDGNGPLIRLAPVAACLWDRPDEAAAAARAQSRATHPGVEAEECSALLAVAMCAAVSRGTKEAAFDAVAAFASEARCASVAALARGEAERPGDAERCWTWREESWTGAPERMARNAGYYGAYSMDALAGALHCVHATSNFRDAVLRAANMRGDADSVAAVAGQLAGAIYGLDGVPAAWRARLGAWDAGRFEGLGRRLFRMRSVAAPIIA